MADRNTQAEDFIGAANASTTAINTILAEEANRIGGDIHRRMVHTSPWIDLIPQTQFPDGSGYQLTTLVYDRAIPTKDKDGDSAGANWNNVGSLATGGNEFSTSLLNQPLNDAADDIQGPSGTGGTTSSAGTDQRSFINFSKQLKKYNIQRAMVESPRINVEDLRYAAHRQDQLRAILDSLAEATRFTWENRYRDEFDRIADNIVTCKTAASVFNTGQENVQSDALAVGADDATAGNEDDTATEITANISNAVLDKCYFQMIRKGAGGNGYGRENGRPVFGLVLSSEASYQLMTEAGFRDDVRYNNAVVSDLIAPLGIEKSFRGFYHLIDDLAPRFASDTTSPDDDNTLNRVEPYTVTNGKVTVNPAYETAPFEAAYIIHPEVMESQIPSPFSGAAGVTFNPVNYKGDFKWTNILNEATNPDGSIGFFRGVLASASKPIKTDCGYAILFRRVSTTPAAV
jgi:hypothetical protein